MTTPIPDPSQPTVYEMIRSVSAKLDTQSQAIARVEGAMHGMVTHDQLRAVVDVHSARMAEAEKDIAATDGRITWWSRTAMAGIGFPVIVGAIMWASGVAVTLPNA